MTSTKRIEAYSVADFVKQIQDAVLEGFRLNLEDNEKYPLQIGVGYYCTMDKVDNKDLTVTLVVDTKETVEVIQDAIKALEVQPSKPGRKPKV